MFLEILIIGILTAFLALFLNYCIGKPGSEKFSPFEIFSFYTVWLAKRRLKNVGLLSIYEQQYEENEERTTGKAAKMNLKNDYKKFYYEAAEPFFTWERAAGMCPICFGVWIAGIVFTAWVLFTTLIFAITQTFIIHNRIDLVIDVISLAIIVLISHVIIRLLTKII